MDQILSEAGRAIGQLLIAGIIYFIFITSKSLTLDSRNGAAKSVLISLASCAFIGFMFAAQAGEPTCLDSEQDLYGSSCTEYDDDGYEATDMERYKTFAFYFVITAIPVLIGIKSALADDSKAQQH